MKNLTKGCFFALLGLLSGCISIRNTFNRAPLPNEDDFRSVLMLGDGKGHLGSGFALFRNGRQYVVTSKHFASYMSGRDTVQIYVNGGWVKSLTRLVGHAKGEVDISVFTFARSTISKAYDQTALLSATDTLDPGSDAWYLGFPLGYMSDDPERNYPYPLLKHAYLSAENDAPMLFYFDGLCNRGFSGGPVFVPNSNGILRLIGVVSARLKETDAANSDANSGIFLAYSVRYAEQIIDANPIGAEIEEH
jgi:hypothetical protein